MWQQMNDRFRNGVFVPPQLEGVCTPVTANKRKQIILVYGADQSSSLGFLIPVLDIPPLQPWLKMQTRVRVYKIFHEAQKESMLC